MKRILLLSKLNALFSCKYVKLNKECRIYILSVCRLAGIDEKTKIESNMRLSKTLVELGADSGKISFLDDPINPDSYTMAEIENSDFIIIPGGRMETGIAKLCSCNLDIILRNYSGTIIGISAGALLLFEQYIVTPNWAYPTIEICKGLGIIKKDWLIEVHYDEDDIKQMESLKKIKSIVMKDIYGIKNSGFIYIDEIGNLSYNDVVIL